MHFKSLALLSFVAGSTIAHVHDHQRRHDGHGHVHPGAEIEARGDGGDDNVVIVTQEVVITVTETLYCESPSPSTSSAQPPPPPPSSSSNPAYPAPAPSSPGSAPNPEWTNTPSNGQFSRSGFGGRTYPSGQGIEYKGNVGSPWGSNIIEVSAASASQYKNVVQFQGSLTQPWTVVFWNKMGPDNKMDGWYGHSALEFTLKPGETRYVAIDDDSQGAWGAAEGSSLPKDKWGGYACTWGEFDFTSTTNKGWSGWDVSMIQAEAAGLPVQGMKICQHNGTGCSYIATGGEKIVNAYNKALADVGGIGGQCNSDAVRLTVHVNYSG